jgi:Family of unknown function (DUF6069)
MPRTVLLTLVAGGLACVVDFLIALVGFRCTPVPRDFPPFTLLPILTGTMTGAVLASLSYAIIQAVSRRPEQTFLFVAVVALVLSFALPLRLSFTTSARFAGVTPAAQMILVLMQTVAATISVAMLLTQAER